MARGHNNSWDFVKEGEQYQYKEDSLIGVVTILKDRSTEDEYIFDVRLEKANFDIDNPEFTVSFNKRIEGYYSGMVQFFEKTEYILNYNWQRTP